MSCLRHTALTVAGLLALGCARERSAPALSVEKPKKAATQATALVFDGHTRGWDSGQRYTYRVALSTHVSFDGKSTNFDFDLAGNVDIVPTSVSPELVALYLAFTDANVVNRVGSTGGDLDRWQNELRRTGAFVSLNGGRANALDIPPGLSEMTMSTYRQLGAALQFTRAEGGAQSYTAEEYDSTGRYLAEYQRAPDGSTWLKRKRSYLSLLGAHALPDGAGLDLTPQIFASSGEVRLSAAGRPEHVKLSDEFGMKGATSPLRSRVSLELTASGTRPQPATDFAPLLAQTRRIAASEPLSAGTPKQVLDDARIGKLDFETIVAALEQGERARSAQPEASADPTTLRNPGPTSETEVQAQSQRFLALAAIFRKDPRAIPKAVAKIRAKSPATGDLLDTLSSAGTLEAQQALVDLLGTKGIDKNFKARLVFSLARAQKPTRQASQALEAVLRDDPFNAGALYGLGTHCRLYRDAGQTAQAREIGELLRARMPAARTAGERPTLLRAIANSGYDGALPEVTRELADKSEEVRVAALRALQSMRDPRVDGLLTHYLLDDASDKARLSAIEAIALRDPTPQTISALTQAATHDSEPHVRYRSVELLIRWLPQRPEVRPVLEQIAQKDDEPKVRERAHAVL
ncbi:MAG TPA: HEAT repeat domain-containing protein [Polyangiaceae bacterium]|nr:HEAT repeat domain-containing protein [Polyangiaceae bacterium]